MDTITSPTDLQTPDVFDVLSYVEQTAYPTEKVVVFRDAGAAAEYIKATEERAALEAKKVPVEDPELLDLSTRIEVLGEKIRKSSMVFELQGMPPGIVQDIMRPRVLPEGEERTEQEAEEAEQERDHELIAKSILRVSNSDGLVDARVWTSDDIRKLRRFLQGGEFGKLLKAVADVNFKSAVFDEATDAGFSS